jgi:SAM-dependent methyltransferase
MIVRVRAAPDIDSLLAPGRTLRAAGAVLSALPADDEGAHYDRRAAAYDRLIGSRTYNRLAWGTSPSQYADFAAEAVAAGGGPLLDAGCGTATFTAEAYHAADRPLVLVDRSVDMLGRAAARLAGAPAAFVQADLTDLPFSPSCFTTVACFGVLHVLDDPWPALAALRDQVAPGGRLFASMLVADRPVGRAYLAALHRAGEVGPLRRTEQLADAARAVFGASADVRRTGSMAWLRATAASSPAVTDSPADS